MRDLHDTTIKAAKLGIFNNFLKGLFIIVLAILLRVTVLDVAAIAYPQPGYLDHGNQICVVVEDQVFCRPVVEEVK